MDIGQLRHPKEKLYRTICMVIGGLIWALALFGTMFGILIMLLPLALSLWLVEKFFQASIYGNAVHVNQQQYAELDSISHEVAKQLGLTDKPDLFVINANGMINALAIKFLSGKYVLLFSNLVDLMWEEGRSKNQLRTVIAHELAHHAAGHVNFWIDLLIKPAMFVPFLGAAYSRACELTADRIAAQVVQDSNASIAALITLASGSRELIQQTSIQAFINQEHQVPGFFGLLQELISTHPRMTRRVIEMNKYSVRQPAPAGIEAQLA